MNSDIIAFTNGTRTPEGEARASEKYPDWEKQLEAWNVTIDNRIITSFERIQDGGKHRDNAEDKQFDTFRVHFTEGKPVERNAFLVDYPTDQTSDGSRDGEQEDQGHRSYTDQRDWCLRHRRR